jgi:hypothetical protein
VKPGSTRLAWNYVKIIPWRKAAADSSEGEKTEYILELTIESPGFVPKKEIVPVLRISPSQEAVILLEPADFFELTVADAATGRPLEYVRVVHQWDTETIGRANSMDEEFITGADGKAHLPLPRGATGIELVAEHPEYAPGGWRTKDLREMQPGRLGRTSLREVRPK